MGSGWIRDLSGGWVFATAFTFSCRLYNTGSIIPLFTGNQVVFSCFRMDLDSTLALWVLLWPAGGRGITEAGASWAGTSPDARLASSGHLSWTDGCWSLTTLKRTEHLHRHLESGTRRLLRCKSRRSGVRAHDRVTSSPECHLAS